uniref:Cysteine lyase n=1 Tax=Thermosporothrix sp. COM3 TaxID=2490863 RepID=A0A455SUY2_9CHLR|nr:cysteine lyase [Thermosporothrix sp. COM3]
MTDQHLERIRQDTPATSTHIYLNTGTFGPLPICVAQAMQQQTEDELRGGRIGGKPFEKLSAIYAAARSNVAQLLHASIDEIALTDNTGEGLNIVCYGFNWQAGDEVITTDHEHVSALAPLYQIRERFGISIKVAELGPRADAPLAETIERLITERTRLIVLSHVTWTTGTVLDIASVNRMAHAHHIPVLIDGAQSAGAIPIDVKELDVDFYALPMQKWLCGPDGTGALFVSQEAREYIQPTYVGYWSAKSFHGDDWQLNESAQRFELGGRQTAAIAGQNAALEWLEKTVGYDWLFARISQLHAYAYERLQTVPGLTLLTPVPGASGLLAFTLDGKASDEISKQLAEHHNILIRDIPETKALRVSTGFYNTEAEIDALVAALCSL